MPIGHAHVSTTYQEPMAPRYGFHAIGALKEDVYADHGLTGATRASATANAFEARP